MKIKVTLLSLFLFLTLAGAPVVANDCIHQIADVEHKILADNTLDVEEVLKARALLAKAMLQCDAGNLEEGLAILDQVKTIFGIE